MAYGFLPVREKNYDAKIVTFLSCDGGQKVKLGKNIFDVPNNVIVDNLNKVSVKISIIAMKLSLNLVQH